MWINIIELIKCCYKLFFIFNYSSFENRLIILEISCLFSLIHISCNFRVQFIYTWIIDLKRMSITLSLGPNYCWFFFSIWTNCILLQKEILLVIVTFLVWCNIYLFFYVNWNYIVTCTKIWKQLREIFSDEKFAIKEKSFCFI